MIAQTGDGDRPRCLRLRIVGAGNLICASIGLIQLSLNVVGYVRLPSAFISQYGPFMRHRFPAMSVATILFLVPLAYAGIGLLRCAHRMVRLSNIIFGAELIFFILLLGTWNFALSPFSGLVVRLGLLNGGFMLQIITAYPIAGLILLNLDSLRKRGGRMSEFG
jgi:hypothetical protein